MSDKPWMEKLNSAGKMEMDINDNIFIREF